MNALTDNIEATCSNTFSGLPGALFAQAVTTLIAAHCSVNDNTEWPEDRYDDVREQVQAGTSFDFIIVGAGTAGSYLASKLVRQFPLNTVLLIEAGDNPNEGSTIPGLMFSNLSPDQDWVYKTESSSEYCLGFENSRCVWNKGKAMGGSTSINAMLYTRANPNDYNEWANIGNNGWDYESVKPYFNNVEELLQLNDLADVARNPVHDVLTGAYKELGFNFNGDNREATEGVGITKVLIKDGIRYNAAKVALNLIKQKHNFFVLKNTFVQRIVIDDNTKTAVGVEIRDQNNKTLQIKSNKEVILSAGSVGSAHILMLSGIGPREHLSSIGIETIIDLPVGKNLQDHVMLELLFEIDEKFSTIITPKLFTFFVLQYMLFRQGPLSTLSITDFMAFVQLKDQNKPDILISHTYFYEKDTNVLEMYHKVIGLQENILNEIKEKNADHDILGLFPGILHPKSRGEILLRDTNPMSHPIIIPNYFKEKEDLDLMIESVEFVQKLLNVSLFESMDIKLNPLIIPGCETYCKNSRAYWECYTRHMATTIYHPVGTAKMGPITDPEAVVDQNLNIHGMKRLRVVDASIMPTITGGNTMAPVLMIAEKAAEIITKNYKNEH